MTITKNSTAESLEALDTTLNFIDCWFKLFDHNYYARCGMYNKAIKSCSKNTGNEIKTTWSR